MRHASLSLLALCSMLLLGLSRCAVPQTEEVSPSSEQFSTPPPHQFSISVDVEDSLRTVFARDLSLALASSAQFRAFIKEEALRKIGGDYDILYEGIKDKDIGTGVSCALFISEVDGVSLSLTDLLQITRTLPLLTISIPEPLEIEVNEWLDATYIPQVAALNSSFYEPYATDVELYLEGALLHEYLLVIPPSLSNIS